MNWQKIHLWFVNNLQEPLLQAEMHRVDMQLPDREATNRKNLRLVPGSKKGMHVHRDQKIDKMREAL